MALLLAAPPALEAVSPSKSALAIQVRGVSHVYRGPKGEHLQALNDVDLDIRVGEFVSIVGPSGCGKTTLLGIMADLLAPTAGDVSVLGRSPRQAREAREYSFVFQRPVLFEWRSVLANVTLPLELAGVPRAEREERAVGALRMMGLERFARYKPWQLSAGMQQRVGLARAVVTHPSILFLDEPFAALDDILREELNLELAELSQRVGATVVMVTHSVSEAVWFSDRIFVMAPGHIVDTVPVHLGRPRAPSIRETDDFFHAVVAVQRLLRSRQR